VLQTQDLYGNLSLACGRYGYPGGPTATQYVDFAKGQDAVNGLLGDVVLPFMRNTFRPWVDAGGMFRSVGCRCVGGGSTRAWLFFFSIRLKVLSRERESTGPSPGARRWLDTRDMIACSGAPNPKRQTVRTANKGATDVAGACPPALSLVRVADVGRPARGRREESEYQYRLT
jgi:hypothetical protein